MMTLPPHEDGCRWPKTMRVAVTILEYIPRSRWRHRSVPPREASIIKLSEVRPADLALSVSSNGSHQSAGTRPRRRHLRTAAKPAPTSEARASGEGQSPITSRNVEMERIEHFLGQLVLDVKPKVSRDFEMAAAQDVLMPERTASGYKQAFIARTRMARERKFEKQEEMAAAMGMDQGKYKQYETRSMLPHQYIRQFCLITGIPPGWLLEIDPAVMETPQRPKRRRRRKAAAA